MAVVWENRSVPVWGTYDVIVCGGGVGGAAAAVAASRRGASVLLLEKSIQLGGLATRGLISWYEPLCDGRGSRIVGGIPKELFDLCVHNGIHSLDQKWIEQPDGNDSGLRCSTHFSPTMFALALDRWLIEGGVEILFDTVVAAPDWKDGRVCGLFVENKDGRGYFEASVVVDATGDADVACRCGIDHDKLSDPYFLLHGSSPRRQSRRSGKHALRKILAQQRCRPVGMRTPDRVARIHRYRRTGANPIRARGKKKTPSLSGIAHTRATRYFLPANHGAVPKKSADSGGIYSDGGGLRPIFC